MSDTAAGLQSMKFDRLNEAVDKLIARFDSLAEAGAALLQSLEALAKSSLSAGRIAPVMVPAPAVQQSGAQPSGEAGGLQKFGEKAVEKFGDKIVEALVDWSFEKITGKKTETTKNPIGFRMPQEGSATASSGRSFSFLPTAWLDKLRSSGNFGSVLAGPVSKAGLGKTSALVIGTGVVSYGLGMLLNKAISRDSEKTPGSSAGPRRESSAAIAALPVFVTNWPAGMGTLPAGAQEGGGSAKVLDQVFSSLLDSVSKKVKDAGGVMNVIGNIRSFLPASWLGRLAGMGRIGAALAAPVGTAGAATTAGLVTASAVAGYGIGKVLNKGMGWASEKISGGKYGGEGWLGSMLYDLFHGKENERNRQMDAQFKELYAARAQNDGAREKEILNNIQLAVRIDEKGRAYTESNDMNTRINLKRGTFNNIGD